MLIDLSKVKPITLGNFVTRGYTWDNEVVRTAAGAYEATWHGLARLTTTNAVELEVKAKSGRKIHGDRRYSWKPLVLPQGAVVTYAALRLPRMYDEKGSRVVGHLANGWTIVGTTGENLKIGYDATGYRHLTTAPVVASANNAHAANGVAIAARGSALDAAAPSLFTTLTADTPVKLYVSNAGNTAAGTGIRLGGTAKSTDFAFIVVEIGWRAAAAPAMLENLGLPYSGDELYF